MRGPLRLHLERIDHYERYACEFGYRYTAEAGEEIRILRRGEHDIPAGLIDHDFWVVDEDEAIEMAYDEHGRFLHGLRIAAAQMPRYRAARDFVWAAAEPFGQWWGRHEELHRRAAA